MREKRRPIISIIMTVYDRKEYYKYALESIQTQSASKELYEVILVSNIPLDLNEYLEMDIRLVRSDDPRLSAKILSGIKIAQGTIITFLEDDDCYFPDRIMKLIQFYKLDEFDFFHNGFTTFKNGNKSIETPVKSGNFILFDRGVEKKHLFNENKMETKFLKLGADFNISSMAIKKEFLEPFMFDLSKLSVTGIDTLLFVLSMKFGNKILVTNCFLTKVRLHNYNSSTKFLERGNEALIETQELVEGIKVFLSDSSYTAIHLHLDFLYLDSFIKYGNYNRIKAIKMLSHLLPKSLHFKYIRVDILMKFFTYLISRRLMVHFLYVYRN